jgi:hypothetical protein
VGWLLLLLLGTRLTHRWLDIVRRSFNSQLVRCALVITTGVCVSANLCFEASDGWRELTNKQPLSENLSWFSFFEIFLRSTS